MILIYYIFYYEGGDTRGDTRGTLLNPIRKS